MSTDGVERKRPALGLVGVGSMGAKIASVLLPAGYVVCAFDPLPAAREEAARMGATVANTLRTVGEQAEIILMSLPGPQQVRSCVSGKDGLLSGAKPGSVIVDTSTVDPGTSHDMWEAARQAGVGYLDAPVLGRPTSIGKWALPIGGTQEDLDKCAPVLALIAAKCFLVGGPGSGNKIKLLNQMMFGAINAMTAEMMAVAEKCGVAPKTLYDAITASQAATVSNLFKEVGDKIVRGDYENPTFSVDLLCKDVRLAVEMAQAAKAPPLLARTVQFVNEMAQAQGHGARDTAAMWQSFKAIWDNPR